MFIYKIILEPVLPLDIWSYRDAPKIGKDDAFLIWENFPFEEPEIFEEEPELGPPPHIIFGNLRNRLLLMLSYRGKDRFDVTLCESRGQNWQKEDLDRSDIRQLLNTFWESEELVKTIKREFEERKRGVWRWLFRKS
ncbi:MAG: hypothetical protein R3B47_00120 [Bacteroidia bacterium]